MEQEKATNESSFGTSVAASALRYEKQLAPRHFPAEAEVPETRRHLELRTALYLVLKANFATEATIGSDQFVYWDPTQPSECLAPDAFLRLGTPDAPFDSWKVWERGAPEVAAEILSRSDTRTGSLEEKLGRYARLGVLELVIFDPDDNARPLRLWNFKDGDYAERAFESARSCWSPVLAVYWVVLEGEGGLALRLSRDPEGKDLLPTPEEVERNAKEAAQRRVIELEAELSRLRGSADR